MVEISRVGLEGNGTSVVTIVPLIHLYNNKSSQNNKEHNMI